MVPIRDPKLVGRKIDCPKCKYRFVVEKPGASEDDKEDEDDTPAPTKKVKKPSAAVKTDKPAAKGAPRRPASPRESPPRAAGTKTKRTKRKTNAEKEKRAASR